MALIFSRTRFMTKDFDLWLDNISIIKLKELKKMEKYPADKRNKVEFFKLQVECGLLNEIIKVRNSQLKKG